MKDMQTQTIIMMDRAKQAVLSRDYQLAARLYKNLLQSDPENLILLKNLGNLYERSGNDQDSIPIYNQIVKLDPKNIDALNSLGGIYRRLKKYDESISVLERAVILDETNSQVFYNLGYTYKLMEKYDDSIVCFNRVVEANSQDVLAYNHLGTIYALQKKFDQAVASYQRGLKIDPNHPILHLNLAKAYEGINNFEQAAQEYENALRYKPGWLDAIDGYVDLLLHRNKTQQAQELVKQAISLNPQNTDLHTKMGNVYSGQFNYDAAELEYNLVIDKKADDRKALEGLANTYEAQGKNVLAVSTMEKMESLYPNDGQMLKQYSHILLTANKINEAGKKIKAVWDQNPNDVQTLNLLGQFYICRNEEAKAFGCFKKIDALNPNYKEYLRDVSERYFQKENLEKAVEYNEKYILVNPDNAKALLNRARYLEKQQNYEASLDVYQQLVAVDPSNLAFKKGLDRVKVKLGLVDETVLTNDSDSIYDNIVIDDDIAPDFGFDDLPPDEEVVDAPLEDIGIPDQNVVEDEGPSLEEQMRMADNGTEASMDYDSLAEDDINSREIFDKLDDEIRADEISDEDDLVSDLDSLVEKNPLDEANDFFESNPFGSAAKDFFGPVEDDMNNAFRSENIGADENGDEIMDVSDGLSMPEEPAFEAEKAFAPENQKKSQASSRPQNAVSSQSKPPAPQAQNEIPQYVEQPAASAESAASFEEPAASFEEEMPVENTAPSFEEPAPAFEEEIPARNTVPAFEEPFADENEKPAVEEMPSFEEPATSVEEELPAENAGTDFEEPATSFEEPVASFEEELPAENEITDFEEPLPSFEEEPAQNLAPQEEDVSPEEISEPMPAEDSEEENFDDIFTNQESESQKLDELGIEQSESVVSDESFWEDAEELEPTQEEELPVEESSVSIPTDDFMPQDDDMSTKGVPMYEEIPALKEEEESVPQVDELAKENNVPLSLGNQEERQVFDAEDFAHGDPTQLDEKEEGYFIEEPSDFLKNSFLDEDFGNENEAMDLNPGIDESIPDDLEDFAEQTEVQSEPEEFVSEENQEEFQQDEEFQNDDFAAAEDFAQSAQNTQNTQDAYESPDACADENTASFENEANALVLDGTANDRMMIAPECKCEPHEVKEKTASLLVMLKNLSGSLPEEVKSKFLSSNEYVQLEYLISRLSGNPGLLSVAEEMRKNMFVDGNFGDSENEQHPVKSLFSYLRSMVQELPEAALSRNLDRQLESTIDEISEIEDL